MRTRFLNNLSSAPSSRILPACKEVPSKTRGHAAPVSGFPTVSHVVPESVGVPDERAPHVTLAVPCAVPAFAPRRGGGALPHRGDAPGRGATAASISRRRHRLYLFFGTLLVSLLDNSSAQRHVLSLDVCDIPRVWYVSSVTVKRRGIDDVARRGVDGDRESKTRTQ